MKELIDLTNFKVFDFSEGVPYVSVTSNGLTFNKSVIMKMDYPQYIRLLINENERQMAVQSCDKFDEKAVPFYKERPKGILSVRINSKDLINTIARLCDWDLKNVSYRVNGLYIPEASLMLFDLTKAITVV